MKKKPSDIFENPQNSFFLGRGDVSKSPAYSKSIQKIVDDMYCKTCGGCGFIGCCGIREFLEKHVKGKTNCSVEEEFIQDILRYIEGEKD